MKKFTRISLLGMVVLGVAALTAASVHAAEYKLKFVERDGHDDFDGTLTFQNVKRTVNSPSSCKGTLTVDGRTYQLNGTHWWPQRSGSQRDRFYSVTLADPSKKVYLSLLLSFGPVSATSDYRWGIAGQALMPEEGKSNKPREEWLVTGKRK